MPLGTECSSMNGTIGTRYSIVSPRRHLSRPVGAMREGFLDQGFRCASPLAAMTRPVGAKSVNLAAVFHPWGCFAIRGRYSSRFRTSL
jgi:hypothetical protein